MTVKAIPQQWKTTDDREFDSQKAAEKHQAIVDARQDYLNARYRLDHLLAESQKTADGVVFRFGRWDEYWYVTPGWSRMPVLQSVGFFARNFDFEGEDEVVIVLQTNAHGEERFPIGELYAEKANAQHALLAAQEAWVKERAAEIEELRKKIIPEAAE